MSSAYNVTLWRIRIILAGTETQQCVLCILFGYMSLQTILYSVEQK